VTMRKTHSSILGYVLYPKKAFAFPSASFSPRLPHFPD